MPPHIIRTIEELDALAPDTCILDSVGEPWLASEAKYEDGSWDLTYTTDLPAVVVFTGEQVRAARKALEEQA